MPEPKLQNHQQTERTKWRQPMALNRFQPDREGSASADKTQRICQFHLPPSQAEIPAQTRTCALLGTILMSSECKGLHLLQLFLDIAVPFPQF